ncbi:Galactokinase [Spironucleus salmonicida]|uniref:Galactokinase n=1 Tax=Spironucleus salmonicida TaxID=348837 RepID=V6LCI3_9EUKA|nr:Galactokinase [Spironucleus salmonicida]|eukprot:EST41386.1 Galactokinase [Spironucleus salmonicida]
MKKINEIYTAPKEAFERYQALKTYAQTHNLTIATFARSPGRVNIISEHTDYNGYQVSPIALENDFIFAVCKDKGRQHVQLRHIEEQLFKADDFDYKVAPTKIAVPNDAWSMYVRAGFHAASVYCEERKIFLPNTFESSQITLIGTGNVPLGSGLSSSSALTCCAALAFLSFIGEEIDKNRLAAIVAKSESLVAIEGGGMDQAISLNAVKGQISVINFVPKLDVKSEKFVDGVLVACMNSLKDSKKANSAANFYNQRVAECRAGCAILRSLKSGTKYVTCVKGREKIDMCLDIQQLYQKGSPSEMLEFCEKLPEKCTLAELKDILGYSSVEQLVKDLFCTKIVENSLLGRYENVKPEHVLVIKKRLQHVYSEADRAQKFELLLKNQAKSKDLIGDLATLINDSQTSCDSLYECSCAELNEVIAESRKCGAFGARLTGAGLGGFAVALLKEEQKDEFMKKMVAFYQAKGETKMEDCVFITGCGCGGGFVKE